MIEPLEYRILKHLQKNDTGEYIDLSSIDDNEKLLNSKLKELINKKFIKKTYTPKKSYISPKDPVYKILFDGINHLKEIEYRKVTSQIEDLTLKKLKFEQIPARFWWLIIIITSLISILTTWVNNQISQSANQLEKSKTEITLHKSLNSRP